MICYDFPYLYPALWDSTDNLGQSPSILWNLLCVMLHLILWIQGPEIVKYNLFVFYFKFPIAIFVQTHQGPAVTLTVGGSQNVAFFSSLIVNAWNRVKKSWNIAVKHRKVTCSYTGVFKSLKSMRCERSLKVEHFWSPRKHLITRSHLFLMLQAKSC